MSDDRTQIIARGSTIEIGTELNQTYRIDALIGVGGMGEVFKGHNIQTGDPVAIKVVLPEYAKDEMIYELFRKEARVLNHLSHDAIVRYYVFSLDRTLGRPYLAMEYVDGLSLAARIKTNPLTPADFFYLLRRLADGLHKAHEAGVIHRDISPDNVILPGGLVENAKIIDFGIARSASVGGGTLLGGSFAGKYSYVSPEQLGLYGGEVTPKSDIYSLALTMAAAIRGHAMDMSGSQVEVIDKRRTVPDLAKAGIPKQVQPILTAMLQPDPANRPASMAAVRDWMDKEQVAARGKTKDQPKAQQAFFAAKNALTSAQSLPKTGGNAMRNVALGAAVVAVIGVGALGGWIYVQSQNSPAPNQVAAINPDTAPAPHAVATNSTDPAPVPTPVATSVAEPAPAPKIADKIPDEAAAIPVAKESAPVPVPKDPLPVATEPATPVNHSTPVVPIIPVVKSVAATTAAPAVAAPPLEVAATEPSAVVAPQPKPAASVVATAKAAKLPEPTVASSLPAKVDVAALTHFVSDYGTGNCLKADVTSMSETTAKLSALGSASARSKFEKEFVIKSGYRPDITFNPVTQDQCALVSGLAKLPSNPKMPLQVKLDRTEIRSNQQGQSAAGDALTVKVTGIGDRVAYLFVVDQSGGIQNINRACPNCIKETAGELTAKLSLTAPENVDSGQPQTYPMIILAVAAAKPLYAVNNQDAYESSDFVDPLLAAATSAENFSAQTAYVTLKNK